MNLRFVLAAALLWSVGPLAGADSVRAQSVPGFQVTTYANVPDPALLAFAPDGTLFTGGDAVVAGSSTPVKINRIGVGGAPVSLYGSAPISDPDTCVFDAAGTISGVPGTVLVGGLLGSSSIGRISGILPDESVVTLFDNGNWANVAEMKFDHGGRLLFSAVESRSIWVSTGAAPTILATLPGSAYPRFLSIAPDDRIAVGGNDNTVRVYNPDGSLANASLASVGTLGGVEWGPGGAFGSDLYVLDASNGELLRVSPSGVKTVVGTGFPIGLATRDIEFSPAGDLFVSVIAADTVLRVSSPWTDQGCALAGTNGDPSLFGSGPLSAGSDNLVELSNAAPSALAALFLGLSSTPVPFKGGTLKPFPFLIQPILIPISAGGALSIPFQMPFGVPGGTQLWVQFGIQDAGAPGGVALSNAIRGLTP